MSGPNKYIDWNRNGSNALNMNSMKLEQLHSTELSQILSQDESSSTKLNNSSSIPRLVQKDGTFNWTGKVVGEATTPFSKHFIEDLFTTVIELQWRWLLLAFCTVYFASWLGFAGIWYTILYVHGDFEAKNFLNQSWIPCIESLKDFTGVFLFSVETQHTTGYGFYRLTEQCSSSIITFCLQSIVGCILEGLLVGILFVKIARAKNRSSSIVFSDVAICRFHKGFGCFELIFRLGDHRSKSNLLETKIKVVLVTPTKEDGHFQLDDVQFKKQKLKIYIDEGEDDSTCDFLFFLPTIVIHRITPSSPLFQYCNDGVFEKRHFEVIVALEGIVDSTGQMTQARTSYVPSEIKLSTSGFFEPLQLIPKNAKFQLDFSKFNEIHT